MAPAFCSGAPVESQRPFVVFRSAAAPRAAIIHEHFFPDGYPPPWRLSVFPLDRFPAIGRQARLRFEQENTTAGRAGKK
jgi:hypothetical protein